jgi:hypothetical protein
VADALEEQAQRLNEADAYYASKVYSAAGERAIDVLNQSVATGGRAVPRGAVSDWKLSDDLWKKLTKLDEEGESLLSGEAAATLAKARQESVEKVQSAEGSASRFNSLLSVYRDNPLLTGLEIYWKTMKETLSTRPLTIIDPSASGRQHLLLLNPNELGSMPVLKGLSPQDKPQTPFPEPHGPTDEEEP